MYTYLRSKDTHTELFWYSEDFNLCFDFGWGWLLHYTSDVMDSLYEWRSCLGISSTCPSDYELGRTVTGCRNIKTETPHTRHVCCFIELLVILCLLHRLKQTIYIFRIDVRSKVSMTCLYRLYKTIVSDKIYELLWIMTI